MVPTETTSPVKTTTHQSFLQHKKSKSKPNLRLVKTLPSFKSNSTDSVIKKSTNESSKGSDNQFINCLYTNIQSILNKREEIEKVVSDHKVDVLLFSETWVEEFHSPRELELIGFQNPVLNIRSRGGTAIYVKEGLNKK